MHCLGQTFSRNRIEISLMNLAYTARQFLRSTHNGVLSTFSNKFTSYPFGSVAPFILDHHAQPVILISSIAEHTKNIIANPKVSLLVFEGNEDLQASSRLTLMGEALKIESDEANSDYKNLRARYLRYFPQSVSYFATHDFAFYRITIAQARFIAGFGKMGWVDGDELAGSEFMSASSVLSTQETSIIEHMNADHVPSMLAYCQHFHGMTASTAEMLGIDGDGFDVKATLADNSVKTIRFTFDQPISDAQSARVALVAMSKASMNKTST